jgi:predicted MFS family arabinose efflux permease
VSKADTPPRRAWWTVGALTSLALLDYADRALIGAVADPIKAEFGFTDTQLGIIMASFVVSRMIFSAPIGRIADIVNRRNLITLSAFILALANIGFGLARNFFHLFTARAVFGACTAGTAIPTLSMIADLFPLQKRGFAMSIWHLSGTFGWAVGAAVAAIATQMYGWRPTVIVFGILSMIIVAIFFFSVREPSRRDSTGRKLPDADVPPLKDVWSFTRRQRSFWHLAVGWSVLNAADLMLANWATPFYARVHGLGLGTAGSAVGFALGVGGVIGVLIGGKLFDYLGLRDQRWHCWLVLASSLLTVPLSIMMYLVPSPVLSVAAMTGITLTLALTYAASTTIPMGLVGGRMRAVTYAVYSVITYAGWAAGPMIAGFVSTRLGPAYGIESLRYALLAGSIFFGLWAAVHFILAARTIRNDYERARHC